MNERDIFIAALQIDDPKDRQEYVDRVCADSVDLKHRIRKLLQENGDLGDYLEEPVAAAAGDVSWIADEPGSMIGRYKLLQQIGEGGFGTVFMADQVAPVRRRIALKIIKPGMDTKEVIARFEAERQALAVMDHPNITRVLDAGETESGRPFFAMELVKGVPLTDFCNNNQLPTADRLKLFISICHAVQHAHQKGIIHRDLKPSNVMVTQHNGQPVPKIIDFGIAKALSQPLTEKTLFTRYGQFVGTPQYMSPEQAELSSLDVDTRSDIYSLGILLYELLTGQPAFDSDTMRAAGFDEMRRIICHEEPLRPSSLVRTLDQKAATTVASQRSTQPQELSRLLHGDLDWIVMKAIDKDRDRRYTTAENLASDITHHLSSEPVTARPPTTAYRLWKLYHRNRRAVLAAAGGLLLLLAASAISLFGLIQARQQRDRATAAERVAIEAKTTAEENADIAQRREAEARHEARTSSATLGLLLDLISQSSINFATGKEVTANELVSKLVNDLEQLAQDEPETAAATYLALGRIAISREESEMAIGHLEKSLSLLKRHARSPGQQLATCLRYLGYARESVAELEQAAALERSAAGGKPHFKTLALIGRLHLRSDNLHEAERVLRQACEQFDEGDRTVLMQENPWFHLAMVLENRGNAREAEVMRIRSVELCRDLFQADLRIWNNAGRDLRYRVNSRCAALFLRAANDIAQVEHKPIPNNACELYRMIGDMGKAKALAIDAIDQSSSQWERNWRYVHAARVSYDVYDLDAAASYLETAINEFSKRNLLSDASAETWCRHELADIYRALGEDDKACRQDKTVAQALQPNIHQPVVMWPDTMPESVYVASTLWSENDSDIEKLLHDAREALVESNWYESLYANTAIGLALERLKETNGAIDAYLAAAKARYYHEELFFGWLEDHLLEVLKEAGQFDRAESIFEELVAKRDRELEQRDPERAFGRIRLAKFLIDEERLPERARELLVQSEEILSHHHIVPDRIKQEVRQLLSRIAPDR